MANEQEVLAKALQFCGKEHSTFSGYFCVLKPSHKGWCKCAINSGKAGEQVAVAKWNGMCPAGKHGLDYKDQSCDLCAKPQINGHLHDPHVPFLGAVKMSWPDLTKDLVYVYGRTPLKKTSV